MTGQDQENAVAVRTGADLSGRDGNGRYTRTIDVAQRDAEAARLRARGYSYRKIAAELGIEVSNAYEMVRRALREVVAEAAEDARQMELERYDAILERLEGLEETVKAVLSRKHYVFSNGRLMYLNPDDPEPLEDDDVVLRAVVQLRGLEDQRLKVSVARAELLGLKIPVKQEIELNAGVEYRIIGVNIGALS